MVKMENILEEENIIKSKNVLNIQSHVVHGYVGNKASTFPLQTLNWDVDVMNTVNFSNHTGYGSLQGVCASGSELLKIYEGLSEIDIKYDAVLTGYVNGFETLEAVGEICLDVKKKSEKDHRNVIWLLDPVMGDEGVLYVNEDVIPVYKKILESGMVDILTPNQYELELLTDQKITCVDSLRKALKSLHEKYRVKHVILSSLFADSFNDLEGGKETLYCCISSTNIEKKLVLFKIDHIDSYFTGVGDMFSALLLDRCSKIDDIIKSTNEVLTIMKKVLTITKLLSNTSGKIGDKNMKDCELRVIECQKIYSETDTDYEPIMINK